MKDILVTNIQRFSLHDGPGIRTTCFLKGCQIRCPWCCNPENINREIQKYCEDGEEKEYGKYYSPEALFIELAKDQVFFEQYDIAAINNTNDNFFEKLPGGVTFSGGEPLLWIEELREVLQKLKSCNIHIAVQTSLFAPLENVIMALEYVDMLYIDIKILNRRSCKEILNGNISDYKKNLIVVFEKKKPIVFRIPVIKEYTDTEENKKDVVELLRKYCGQKSFPIKVELLKEHNLGISKYKALSKCDDKIKIPLYRGVDDKEMVMYKESIEKVIDSDITVEICQL